MNEKEKTYSKKVIEIADYIFKNPQSKTAEIIAVFCGKLRKKKRTIELYIAQAKEYNTERSQKQEKVRDEVLADETKNALKSDILSRNESLEILSSIAKNSQKDYEKTRAITVLADIQGWNAPKKNDVTVNEFDITKLTPEEKVMILEIARRKK